MQARPITALDAGSTSSTGAGGQTIVTGTPTAGSVQSVNCAQNPPGRSGLVIVSGTFTQTLVIECSYDGGVTWNGTIMIPVGQTTPVTSLTGPCSINADIDGATNFRVRCTAFTSGVANVNLSPGQPPELPFAPGIRLTPISGTAIDVTWSLISGATSYDVWRGTTSGGETSLATAQPGPVYHDTGLSPNTSYFYYMFSNSAVGKSQQSVEATIKTLPGAPTAPSATGGTTGVTVAFTAPSGGADSYKIYRGTATGAEGATHYAQITGTSFLDTGVKIGTTYFYIIKAVNASGDSVASTEVSAAPTLAAPTLPSATAGTHKVTLGWTASAGATGYNIYRSTTTGTEKRYAENAQGTSFVDYGALTGQVYFYKISAINSMGESALSTEVTTTPLLMAAKVPEEASQKEAEPVDVVPVEEQETVVDKDDEDLKW